MAARPGGPMCVANTICQGEKAVLFAFWASSCSWRVRAALVAKRVPFEERVIDILRQKEQKTATYREICPSQKVPALVIDEKYNKIFTILYNMSHELSLFDTFHVDKILELRIVSVSELARGQGLAKELMRRSTEIAKDNGFKLFKVDATGAYSQRVCTSLGLRTLRRIPYSEYCDANGAPVFNVPPPHEALCIMVLEIPN